MVFDPDSRDSLEEGGESGGGEWVGVGSALHVFTFSST